MVIVLLELQSQEVESLVGGILGGDACSTRCNQMPGNAQASRDCDWRGSDLSGAENCEVQFFCRRTFCLLDPVTKPWPNGAISSVARYHRVVRFVQLWNSLGTRGPPHMGRGVLLGRVLYGTSCTMRISCWSG